MVDAKTVNELLKEVYAPRIKQLLTDSALIRSIATEEEKEALKKASEEYKTRLSNYKQIHKSMIASAFSWTPLPRLA